MTAERAWQRCRREVWAGTNRYRIPRAATIYDGMTDGTQDALQFTSSCIVFNLIPVLEALAKDRATLEAFERTRGAKAIADYLRMSREDLDAFERAACERANWAGPDWLRPRKPLGSAMTYGSSPKDDR